MSFVDNDADVEPDKVLRHLEKSGRRGVGVGSGIAIDFRGALRLIRCVASLAESGKIRC